MNIQTIGMGIRAPTTRVSQQGGVAGVQRLNTWRGESWQAEKRSWGFSAVPAITGSTVGAHEASTTTASSPAEGSSFPPTEAKPRPLGEVVDSFLTRCAVEAAGSASAEQRRGGSAQAKAPCPLALGKSIPDDGDGDNWWMEPAESSGSESSAASTSTSETEGTYGSLPGSCSRMML